MMRALIRDDLTAFKDMNTIRSDESEKETGKSRMEEKHDGEIKITAQNMCLPTIIMICLTFVIWSVQLIAANKKG